MSPLQLCSDKKQTLDYNRSILVTLAWWRSTPYMDSFFAFSKKCISASAGVIPLIEQQQHTYEEH